MKQNNNRRKLQIYTNNSNNDRVVACIFEAATANIFMNLLSDVSQTWCLMSCLRVVFRAKFFSVFSILESFFTVFPPFLDADQDQIELDKKKEGEMNWLRLTSLCEDDDFDDVCFLCSVGRSPKQF